MGNARRLNEVESQTRAVVELDFSLNFATGNAPVLTAQNECVTITRTGAGAYTLQVMGNGKEPMAPGYARLLNKNTSFSNSSNLHVRWGNYSRAAGTLPFTIHADGTTATPAADPADAANLNLDVTLRFKHSESAKN
jgi:hypothetical protein